MAHGAAIALPVSSGEQRGRSVQLSNWPGENRFVVGLGTQTSAKGEEMAQRKFS